MSMSASGGKADIPDPPAGCTARPCIAAAPILVDRYYACTGFTNALFTGLGFTTEAWGNQ